MAGESWMTHSLHVKGFDSFTTSTYAEGGSAMIAALRSGGVDVTYQPCHVAANSFPGSAEALSAFDVVILSDIGANTLLLRDATFVRSELASNRLELLRAYVEEGGALLMIGGYLTFQGIEGKAAYHGTPVKMCSRSCCRQTMTAAKIPREWCRSPSTPVIPSPTGSQAGPPCWATIVPLCARMHTWSPALAAIP